MPDDQNEADDLFSGAAAAPKSPLLAKAGADNRKESRVRANWQARVLLPPASARSRT